MIINHGQRFRETLHRPLWQKRDAHFDGELVSERIKVFIHVYGILNVQKGYDMGDQCRIMP